LKNSCRAYFPLPDVNNKWVGDPCNVDVKTVKDLTATSCKNKDVKAFRATGGKLNDVHVYVRQKHPLAVYVHCAVLSLNLAISEAFPIDPIRNCMTIIVNRFLKISASLPVSRRKRERPFLTLQCVIMYLRST
jgi:hypothetical protein